MTRPQSPDLAAEVEMREEAYTCCSQPMTWDAARRGFTCGGLELQGWMVCQVCDSAMLVSASAGLPERSRVAEQTGSWLVAKGGRSMTAGGIKLRADKADSADVMALMERIAKLPELEAEVERLRAELGYRKVAP
jgi:hypothetical protein